MPVALARPNVVERFMAKVVLDDDTGCWLWTGGRLREYGAFKLDGKQRLAHRVAYELFVGPIPGGLELDHVWARGCRHKHCVNPAHLEPVTPRENTRRAPFSPSGVNARRTQCISGHPFDVANTYITPDGRRQCRVCRNDRHHRAAISA